jgi:hypothetical protein
MRTTRNNFIPLNNDLNKLQAFIPSLDKRWRGNQKIKSKEYQIETLDAIEGFQKEGWKINGAYEKRGSDRRIQSHMIKMQHPDFGVKNLKGHTEAIATLNISNSCNGSKPMEMDLGAFRQVCSNGLMAHTSYSHEKVSHTQKSYFSLPQIMARLNSKVSNVMDEFNKLKNVELDPVKAMSLAVMAAETRFGKDHGINVDQLLNITRKEDEGNDLWSVYNRIQENVTQPNRIFNPEGKLITGINDPFEDRRVNRELFQLAYAYA